MKPFGFLLKIWEILQNKTVRKIRENEARQSTNKNLDKKAIQNASRKENSKAYLRKYFFRNF